MVLTLGCCQLGKVAARIESSYDIYKLFLRQEWPSMNDVISHGRLGHNISQFNGLTGTCSLLINHTLG